MRNYEILSTDFAAKSHPTKLYTFSYLHSKYEQNQFQIFQAIHDQKCKKKIKHLVLIFLLIINIQILKKQNQTENLMFILYHSDKKQS